MIETLLRASLDGAVAAVVVWLLCRYVTALPAAARALLWWCAAAKFLVALVWVTPIAVPILPPAATAAAHSTAAVTSMPTSSERGDDAVSSGPAAAIDIASAVLIVWIAGVGLSLSGVFTQWRRAGLLVREAQPAPEALVALTAELAASTGLAAPPVRISTRARTPLVVGLGQSTIVLPAALVEGLSAADQRMAISHELAHIQRRDLRWGCVPALAEALFFFHPLARVAAREYALWREAACDAAALAATQAAPEDYARLLLGLGVTRPHAGLTAGGGSASFANMKRRLVMLHAPTSRSTSARLAAGGILGLAALAIVPIQLTARVAVAPAPVAAAVLEEPQRSERPREVAPEPYQRTVVAQERRRISYVVFRDDVTHLMDGSISDLKHAEQFRKGNEELLWVRTDGREYLSRDAALLRQMRELWRPIGVISDEQSRIGEAQSKIGDRQSEMGEAQSRIGIEQSKIGIAQSEIGLRQSALSREMRRAGDGERRRLEEERLKLEDQLRELEKRLENLDRQLKLAGEPLETLGAEMEVQGQEMERLSRRMEEASKRADAETRELIDRAIRTGVLQPIK